MPHFIPCWHDLCHKSDNFIKHADPYVKRLTDNDYFVVTFHQYTYMHV